ncbi:MAG: M43 family zinc metalloprotease, partial [Bacteroidota bacterium]
MCGTPSPGRQQIVKLRSEQSMWVAKKNRVLTSGELVYVPIAFHVVRKNDGSCNVTDSQINNQVAILNSTFSWFTGLPFRFFIYSIDRWDNSTWNVQTVELNPTDAERSMKYALCVDPAHVLNFYTADVQSYNGYARFPSAFADTSKLHGVVVDFDAFVGGNGSPYNLGDLAVHEVGHYFGLLHTFEGGCDEDGDLVDDTPKQQFGDGAIDCSYPWDSCPLDEGIDPINNFMNYTPDSCRNEFTAGQVERMNLQTEQYRAALYGSSISVTQKRENGSELSGTTVNRWEGISFAVHSIPWSFKQLSGTNLTLQANQEFVQNPVEKFNNWNSSSNVQNHSGFTVGLVSEIVSNFKGSHSASIRKLLVDGSLVVDSVQFQDPWLIDYPDATYGNSLRNQGMSAPFKSVASATNNLGTGTSYKGVFLNQNSSFDPNLPIYWVRAPLAQSISGSTAFFQGWSYHADSATLQQVGSNPAGYDQKAVVFKLAGATVTAQYAGPTFSSNATIPAGTYTVSGTLTVSSGTTLTISAGTTLHFPTGTGLVVNGRLVAEGTSQQPITLNCSSSNNYWTGISFSGADNSSLSHCTIDWASSPVVVSNTDNITIDDCTIGNSNFQGSPYYAAMS